MRKLLVLLMVLAFAAPVVPVMADDTLDLSGAMRVRAWKIDNEDYTDDDQSDHEYWDQRLRIQGKITPADGVMAVFRVDLSEDVWGSNAWQGSRYGTGDEDVNDDNSGGELQVDRAYLDITRGMLNIKAGEQYIGLGNNFAYDNNATGLVVTVKTPLTIRLGFVKIDEDQVSDRDEDTDLSDDDGFEDVDHWLVDLGYKADAFAFNIFYATQKDGLDDADEPNLIGAMAKFNLGPANVFTEVNKFGGSDDDADVDYMGLQFIADVSMKFTDMVTAGVQLIWSDGNDESDEVKLTRMPNAFFGSQYYADLGAFNTDIAPLGGGDVFDPFNESGAMGFGLYADVMPMDGLTLFGQFVWLTNVEDGTDERSDGFDNGYLINLTAQYEIVPNAHVAVGYNLVKWDALEDLDPEDRTTIVGRLQVNF